MLGFLPGLLSVAGALVGGIGKRKQQKAQQKKEQEDARLKFEAGKKAFHNQERRRINSAQMLTNAAGSRGIKGFENLPPELMEEQEFSGQVPGKETGTSGMGDFLEGVGNAAMGVGDFMGQQAQQKQRQQQSQDFLCRLYPEMCEQAGPPSDMIERG